MKNRRLIFAAKLGLTALLLWALYRKLSFADLSGMVASLRPAPVLAFIALLFVNTFLSALKWRLLLRADGVDIPLGRLFASYLIGSFFNLFLPSNIGGDAYRVVSAGAGGALSKSFTSVLADRFSGFVALAAFGLAASLVGFRLFQGRPALLLPLAGFVAILAAIGIAMRRTWMERILAWTRVSRIAKLRDFALKCSDSFEHYLGNRGLLLRIMGISFLFQAIVVLCIRLLCMSMPAAQTPPWLDFFVFVPIISILEALPVTIFGIGLRDTGYFLFFTQSGVADPNAQALAISLLYMAATVAYTSIGGCLFLARLFSARRPEQQRSAP